MSESRVPPIPWIVITITIIIVMIQVWTDPQSTAARSKKVRDAGKRQLKQVERVWTCRVCVLWLFVSLALDSLLWIEMNIDNIWWYSIFMQIDSMGAFGDGSKPRTSTRCCFSCSCARRSALHPVSFWRVGHDLSQRPWVALGVRSRIFSPICTLNSNSAQ